MFFERYIKDPLQFAWSDPKKIFVGGVFQLISIGGIVLGLAIMFASVISAIGVPEFGSLPQLTLFSGLVGIFLGVIIAMIGVVFTAFIYGYYMRVIENTLGGSFELPEWEDFKVLLNKGAYFFLGIFILQLIFGIISIIVTAPFVILLMLNDGYSNLLIFNIFMNLVSFVLSVIEALYITLAAINFVDKKEFMGFFDLKEVVSKISIEYVLVIVAVTLVSILVVIPVVILLLIPVLIGIFTQRIFLMIAIAIIVLAMPFLQMFLTVFGYRSYSNYYVSKKESILEEKTDFENNE
uniref:MFS family permease n=1 Tax=Methanococcus maripaludis (strain C6 / ATCC BAA-1332) TaxID=444158 RepID=A9A957_METM6